MPRIAYNMAKMKQNGVLRFIMKSQTWYNIFSGTNERVARNLGAQWKIRLWIQSVGKLLVMIYPLTLHNMITPNKFSFLETPKVDPTAIINLVAHYNPDGTSYDILGWISGISK